VAAACAYYFYQAQPHTATPTTDICAGVHVHAVTASAFLHVCLAYRNKLSDPLDAAVAAAWVPVPCTNAW
jgi:hypothetical protein